MNEKPTQTSAQILSEIHAALKAYSDYIQNSGLSYGSQAMYIDFATCFVRWLEGDFVPRPRRAALRVKDETPSDPTFL